MLVMNAHLSRLGIRIAIAALIGTLAGPVLAQNSQVIYDDALENGWVSYGWATLNFSNTSPVYSGAYSISVDAVDYGALYLHHDAFNTGAYAPEQLGQLGDAARRTFQGPGIENFDLQISKNVRLRSEAQSLDFRVEAFNVFNHAQFYGPASVAGQVDDPNFGHIVSSAAPRLVQLVAKFTF